MRVGLGPIPFAWMGCQNLSFFRFLELHLLTRSIVSEDRKRPQMGALQAACKEQGGDCEASPVATATAADGLRQASSSQND
jgi:hypothetical protein